jgi:hypothetical protein
VAASAGALARRMTVATLLLVALRRRRFGLQRVGCGASTCRAAAVAAAAFSCWQRRFGSLRGGGVGASACSVFAVAARLCGYGHGC